MCKHRDLIALVGLVSLTVGSVMANEISVQDPGNNAKKRKSPFSIEGGISLELSTEWNYDLNEEDGGTLSLEPSGDIGLEYKISKDALAYISLDYGREMELEEEDRRNNKNLTQRSYESTLEVDEAFFEFEDFLEVKDFIEDTSLTIGRFSASDKREWFFDESLDGIWLSFEVVPMNTEFSLSFNRKDLIGSDLLRHNEFDSVNNFIFVAEHKPPSHINLEFDFYAILRDDRSDENESPRFFGLRSLGGFAERRFTYWADFALARGEDGEKQIKGYGLDVGTTMYFHAKPAPYVTLGYAYGSGDGHKNSDFRQTDLQGNSDRFGGVSSLKYYGELLDPELSNLHIFTAGLGFRISPTASIDFVLHHYLQDVALDELRSADVDEDPSDKDKEIGSELDIVVGVDLTSKIEAEFVFGYFESGAAFDDKKPDNKNAMLFNAEISYEF